MSDEANELEVATNNPVEVEGPVVEQGQQEEKPKQSGYEKRINTLSARNKHQSDELAKANRELEDLRSKVPQAPAHVVPKAPEDDLRYENEAEYIRQNSARDEALLKQGSINARKEFDTERENTAKQKAYDDQVDKNRAIAQGFEARGIEVGLSKERMLANEQSIVAEGVTPEVASAIYTDKDGPLIAEYLADNPDKLRELNEAGFMTAGGIFSKIKENAISQKPLITGAPDPISPTHGGGVTPSNEWDSLAQGATFE